MNRLDISTSFNVHPDTGDLLVRTNNNAIQQMLANLVLLDQYDVPFRPNVGSKFRSLLFEQISPATAKMIKSLVQETISNSTTLIDLQQVVVTPEPLRHRYVVSLVYRINGETQSITQNILLSRAR